jgi:hypothetical protein
MVYFILYFEIRIDSLIVKLELRFELIIVSPDA